VTSVSLWDDAALTPLRRSVWAMATYLRSRCLPRRDAVQLCDDLARFYTRTRRPERVHIAPYAYGWGVYVTIPDELDQPAPEAA
jgi:hypothetical protein